MNPVTKLSKSCEYCSTNFEVYPCDAHRRFCCSRCFYDHRKEHGMIESWSRKFDCCVHCGKTNKPHHANGYCKKCHSKDPKAIENRKKQDAKKKALRQKRMAEQWTRDFRQCRTCLTKDKPHHRYGYCKECFYKSDEKRAESAKYYSNNVEKISEYGKRYNLENRDKLNEYQHKYRKTLYGRLTSIAYAHTTRVEESETDVTTAWLVELWNKTTVCELCNKEMRDDSSYPDGKHLDHIIPLRDGGSNGGHTRSNVRFICGGCNFTRA